MIQFDNLLFVHTQGGFRLDVPELEVPAGEKAALIGPSGSGKTTLLHLAAGILLPESGSVRLFQTEISSQSDAMRRRFRIANIGLIFQEFELLEYLTVYENILLPYRINPALKPDDEVRRSVNSLANSVGIGDALFRRPSHLSQGERQRVAISRALITRPRLILADEPTGNLDPKTSRSIVEMLLHQPLTRDATVLTVTHDHGLLDQFDRVIDLETISRKPASRGVNS